MKEFIVDACILTGFLKNEKSAPVFADYLDRAFTGEINLTANSVNLGEFYFTSCRFLKSQIVESFLSDLVDNYNLKVNVPDYEDCLQAAKIKAQGGIAYFDCFNLVLANRNPSAIILTLDKEYQKFSKDYTIKFL